jgi:hypothetical protein
MTFYEFIIIGSHLLPDSKWIIKKVLHQTFCAFKKWFFSVREHNISPQELCFRDYKEERTGILLGYKVRQAVKLFGAQVTVDGL